MTCLLHFLLLLLTVSSFSNAFPYLTPRFDDTTFDPPFVPASVSASIDLNFTWSPSQLVDVTGAHAYQDPIPGQARGPCPAQNALANHGYLDRSGYTTFSACVSANCLVYNIGLDFASFLCLIGVITGGDTLGLTPFSIGNASAFDSTVKTACPPTIGLLGIITSITCKLSYFLDNALGTQAFGMAQTHNAFEGDSSFLQPDWNTINGLDASTLDISAVNLFWSKQLADRTFDDFQIIVNWTHDRKVYGIANNPCYFRAPQATNLAALGAYALVPRMFSNYTPEKPGGTLTYYTLANFFGLSVDSQGNPQPKGRGKEEIPSNWYHRPIPYTIPEFLAFDYSRFVQNDPELISIGGNTNGVNTYTGLDPGNLTGGVYNSANLLQGDNFACFYYRLLQVDLQNKLPNAVFGDLLVLGNTVGQVVDAVFGKCIQGDIASCPTFTYNDIHNFKQYCGVGQQQGGIY